MVSSEGGFYVAWYLVYGNTVLLNGIIPVFFITSLSRSLSCAISFTVSQLYVFIEHIFRCTYLVLCTAAFAVSSHYFRHCFELEWFQLVVVVFVVS